MKRYAEIVAGKVVNVAVVDEKNIPPHMASWTPCGNAGDGWLYDGTSFTPPEPPSQADKGAIIEAAIDAEVDALFNAATRREKALGEMMWQIARASKTGDWSYFDGVTKRSDFRDLFRQIVASM